MSNKRPIAYVPRATVDGDHQVVGELRLLEIEERPFACTAGWECLALYDHEVAEVDRLRGLAERAADMLTAYGELIRRDGASHVEEHHYLPEVEHTASELRALALGEQRP